MGSALFNTPYMAVWLENKQVEMDKFSPKIKGFPQLSRGYPQGKLPGGIFTQFSVA
jgi:hypothetical protein